jgi:protein unc-45
MSTSETVEKLKSIGNKCFETADYIAAIESYSKALDLCRADIKDCKKLQSTILSNRAASYLSLGNLHSCIDDCTEALSIIETTKDDDNYKLRAKILYRRAKAWYLLSDIPSSSSKNMLQDAAKDLLQVLSMEPKNNPAGSLLRSIRAKHDQMKGTPISQTLDSLKATNDDDEECNKHLSILLGLLSNDEKYAPLEFGRRSGVNIMIQIRSVKSLQVLTCASSNPKFVSEYGNEISQELLREWMLNETDDALKLGFLSLWLRLVLYLDPLESESADSLIDDSLILQSCVSAFSNNSLLPAALDVVSSWTAVNRQTVVIASTTHPVFRKYTESELRTMKPREVAAIKKREYELSNRDKQWANRRAMLFCSQGGLQGLLHSCCESSKPCHGLRKRVGVVLGRIFSSIQNSDDVKKVVQPFLESTNITIQEIDETKEEKQLNHERLITVMTRAQLISSLLLGHAQVGTWALEEMSHEIPELIESGDLNAMSIASELISAGASVEKGRPIISSMFRAGTLEILLEHPEQDIRSGVASAIAKIGMADKNLDEKEGEVMELLQVASELLHDEDSLDAAPTFLGNASAMATQGTTSIERGIEIIGYLSSKTQIKEELAHGFKANLSLSQTTLERLVELANQINSEDSISAYALATTFCLIAVSNETLRKESFIGKDLTMEQYDELQKLGKSEEEKQALVRIPEDNENAVEARIRKLAMANAPRAMVKMIDGASESTLEKIVNGLNRMATETSVRGILIQQGALTACMKFDEEENASDVKKRTVREAYQCISRLLVTTNPSILTTSQRIGAIKPLLRLIRNSDATDLQRFEALLALTNLATSGGDAKERIVSEKGISILHYAMFSDHSMVRRASTEAMCNLIPHPAMIQHLTETENLRLWMAFATDFDENFECARAAAGCLAMAVDILEIGVALVNLKSFRESMMTLMESGNLELIHRAMVIIQSLLELNDDECRQNVIAAGLVAFCRVYIEKYHDGAETLQLDFSPDQRHLMSVTIDLAKKILTT